MDANDVPLLIIAWAMHDVTRYPAVIGKRLIRLVVTRVPVPDCVAGTVPQLICISSQPRLNLSRDCVMDVGQEICQFYHCLTFAKFAKKLFEYSSSKIKLELPDLKIHEYSEQPYCDVHILSRACIFFANDVSNKQQYVVG